MEFGEFQIGDHVWLDRTFTSDDFAAFARLSGDRNPLHHDQDFAAKSSFGKTITPIHLAAAPLSYIAGMVFPGESSLYLGHTLKAVAPVSYDLPVTYSARISGLSTANNVLNLRVLGLQNENVILDATLQVKAVTQKWTAPPDIAVRRASEQNRIVVTGAAGEIGRSTAARLAQQKFDLVLVARRITPTMEGIAATCRAFGVRVDIVPGDLEQTKDRARICAALRKWDDVAALVHVASPAVAAPVETQVKVNFEALVEMTQALMPGFLRRQKGRVIAIGSSSVEIGISGWEPYAGAKAMLSQYLHTFDRKQRSYGITAQVVAPTRVDTAMSRATGAPHGTMLIPEEVAACITDSVTNPQADTTYLSLSPSGTRAAYYGVYSIQAPPTGDAAHQPAPHDVVPSQRASSTDASGLAKLERTVRAALALPAAVALDNGGLGLTPGWDSLKHIEIMLAVERDFAIEFSSSEIDRLSTYAGLRTRVDAKSRKN